MRDFSECVKKYKSDKIGNAEYFLQVVMMVGIQGSGKSFFANHYLEPKGYEVANNDTTGSRDKTLKVLMCSVQFL